MVGAERATHEGTTMSFLATWLSSAIAIAIAIAIIPGIRAVGGSYLGPAVCALALALVNAVVMPVAQILSLPITFLTLGIFYLVVNAFMLELASWLSVASVGSGIEIDSFGSAFIGSIVISLLTTIVSGVIMG